MIAWQVIGYGATLSALAAGGAVAAVARGHRARAAAGAAVGAVAGPIAWNAILRATHGDNFFVDAPVSVFPVSWQDTGSGVFALAATALLLGLLLGDRPARRVTGYATLAALAAFLVDIYLY
jgi:hypothetical protein